MTELLVSELAIYPVKSLAGIPLQAAALQRFGLKDDRRWMLVDDNGRFLSQRQHARMCLVQPSLHTAGVSLHAMGMPDLLVPRPTAGDRRPVIVWDDRCNALDCGDAAAAWLSVFLSVECRLVYFPDDEVRAVDPRYALPGDRTAFSDGFPLLLISQASLDDLNSRLDVPVSMARFRPNLVVRGCAAFAEDDWQEIRIGDLRFRIVKPCSRCTIPAIDPLTGERDQEPLRTLAAYRKRGAKIFFGQNVIADGEGELRVGMRVEVLA
jgi:uncharacterized protein YcbX